MTGWQVVREVIVDGGWLEKRLGVPFRGSGVPRDIQNGAWVRNLERGARPGEDLEDGLTYPGNERVDVHERLDVTACCAGVGMSLPL